MIQHNFFILSLVEAGISSIVFFSSLYYPFCVFARRYREKRQKWSAFSFSFLDFLGERRIENVTGACCTLAVFKGHLVAGWQPNDSVKQLLSYSIISLQQKGMFLEILFPVFHRLFPSQCCWAVQYLKFLDCWIEWTAHLSLQAQVQCSRVQICYLLSSVVNWNLKVVNCLFKDFSACKSRASADTDVGRSCAVTLLGACTWSENYSD